MMKIRPARPYHAEAVPFAVQSLVREGLKMNGHHRITTALVAVIAALAASACGSSSSPTPTPASSSAGASTTAPTASATVPAVSSGGSLCQQAASYRSEAAQMTAALGKPGANELATMKQVIGLAAQAIDTLDGEAPSAIASAVHTLRATFDQVNTTVQGLTTFSAQSVQAVFAPAETAAVKAASTQVTDYFKTACP
jgi:hypothetical protein